MIKQELKKLYREGFNDIQAAHLTAHKDTFTAQEMMHQNQRNLNYVDAKLEIVHNDKVKHQVYVELLEQTTKLNWVKHGDENTRFYYKIIKSRRI